MLGNTQENFQTKRKRVWYTNQPLIIHINYQPVANIVASVARLCFKIQYPFSSNLRWLIERDEGRDAVVDDVDKGRQLRHQLPRTDVGSVEKTTQTTPRIRRRTHIRNKTLQLQTTTVNTQHTQNDPGHSWCLAHRTDWHSASNTEPTRTISDQITNCLLDIPSSWCGEQRRESRTADWGAQSRRGPWNRGNWIRPLDNPCSVQYNLSLITLETPSLQ